MKNKGQAPSPFLVRALGTKWLSQYLSGKKIKDIKSESGKHVSTIVRYMKKAAEEMVEEAQRTIMSELVPLATQVMKAKLEQELANMKSGAGNGSTQLADRILKGMSIIDQQSRPEHDGQSDEPDTLVALMARKTKRKLNSKPPLQVTEGETVKDGNEDNPSAETESGPRPNPVRGVSE